MPIHVQFYQPAIWKSKVGEGDLVLMCNQDSLVGLCMQDYKSLCTAVKTCATLVVLKFDSYIFTSVTLKSRPNPTLRALTCGM